MARVSTVLELTLLGTLCCLLSLNCVSPSEPTAPEHTDALSPRDQASQRSSEAYVTLLYGQEYALGVRVLGQSLRNTNTDRDYIVLCTEDVSESTKAVLRSDGWIVKSVQSLANPYEGFPSFLVKVFTKLLIWTLTEYKKVVYIDCDAIVLRNIDHLFRCGNFCVAYRHSDLFNTGVLVLDPSQEVFKDMTSKFGVLDSYTGGDQGFLNVYFNEVKYHTLFDRNRSKPDGGYMRLPAGYNADIGIYYTVSKWRIPQEELMILHYTLGPLKPWRWWSYPLFDLNWEWLRLRAMLPSHQNEVCIWNFVYWLPLLLLGTLYISSKVWFPYYNTIVEQRIALPLITYVDPINGVLALPSVFHIVATLGSWYLAFSVVPSTIWPVHGWIVQGIWFFFFLFLSYFPYCHFVHVVGQLRGQQKRLERIFTAKQETLMWMLVLVTFYFVAIYVIWGIAPFSACFRAVIVSVVLGFVLSRCVSGRLVTVWFGFKSVCYEEKSALNHKESRHHGV